MMYRYAQVVAIKLPLYTGGRYIVTVIYRWSLVSCHYRQVAAIGVPL